MADITGTKKWNGLRYFLKSPRKLIKQDPYLVMIFSVPAAIILFFIGGYQTGFTPALDHVFFFAILIAVLPPGLMHYTARRSIKKIEEYFPNFLRDVAEMNRSGMTLTRSVNTVAKGEYGELTREIRQIDAMLSWGVSFEEALEKFANRMATPLISRSVALINQASRAGGNVPDVLEVAAKDAYTIKLLERERSSVMIIYVIICYMSFLVFLFVIGILSHSFITVMASAGTSSSSMGMQGGGFISSFEPEAFKRLFFHASLIQGFASGLVAGQMGEGELAAGLKHSVILALIGWLAFVFVI